MSSVRDFLFIVFVAIPCDFFGMVCELFPRLWRGTPSG